jgi:hypothetical protein
MRGVGRMVNYATFGMLTGILRDARSIRGTRDNGRIWGASLRLSIVSA